MAEPYVFLSYASVDQARVSRIAERLEGAGIRVWFDRAAIAGGATWSEEIVRAIQGCSALVVLCSRASMISTNVQRELQLAMEDSRPMLPLLLERVDQPPAVRYILAGRQSIELLDRPEAEWLPQVRQALGRLGVASAGSDAVSVPALPPVQVPQRPKAASIQWVPVTRRRAIASGAVLALAVVAIAVLAAGARAHFGAGRQRTGAEAGASGQQSGAPAAAPRLTVFAGNGQAGHVNGPVALAEFSAPQAMQLLPDGSLLVGDAGNGRVRKTTPDGAVSTLAGSGIAGFADGAGAQAKFGDVGSMTIYAPTGDLYVMDGSNHRIRKITPAGVVSTVFEFTDPDQTPRGITVSPSGTFYLSDPTHNRIYAVTGIVSR